MIEKDPTIKEQIIFYDNWNVKNRSNDNYISDDIRLRCYKVIDSIRSLNLTRPSILEVGCGTGWLTEKLSNLGNVTAIDLSPAAIAIARKRNTQAEFIAGDFFEYKFNQPAFDVIVCVETLFYVMDQPRFIQKIASHMINGGFLFVTTINKFVYERNSAINPPVHGQIRKWLNKREMKNMLSPYFEILSMTTMEPGGDRGVLRLVNSFKINTALNRLFPSKVLKRVKERIGLGGGIVIICRRIN